MAVLPQSVKEIDLLRWVAAHPNQAFDPAMVVSATHATDWQWQAVSHQMEDLGRQTYITRIKSDPTGVTFWTITPKGENYLRALERAETANQGIPFADSFRIPGLPNEVVTAPPVPTATVVPPTVAKEFVAHSIALNGASRLTFTINNPNPKAELTDIGFTDVLPEGLVVSDPSGLVGSWAEGELTAIAGTDRISLFGAKLPGGGSCTFQLTVTGVTEGTKDNVTGNVTSRESGPGGTAVASIVVFPGSSGVSASTEANNSSEWLNQATIDRFSETLRLVLKRADEIRSTRKRPAVSTLHLVLSFGDQPGGQLSELLRQAGVTQNQLVSLGKDEFEEVSPADVASGSGWRFPRITRDVRLALITARNKADEMSSLTIDDSHLLFGLLSLTETDNLLILGLHKQGITADKVQLPTRGGPPVQTPFAQPGYKSDDPIGEDLLDITKEVNALASVLAAKEVDPPLSLGLFGDWGTGKSFFMRRLECRIRELTEDAKQAKGESQYCQDVVQLTFNAWNYIDRDLWASLASEIFEGLAAALANKRGGDSQDGRALALAVASSSPAVVAETERQKVDAEARLKEAGERLEELQRSQAAVKPRLSAREVLNQAALFAVKDEDLLRQADEAAENIGISKGKAAVGEIQSQILELEDTWSKIAFTVRNNGLSLWVLACLMAFGLSWGVMYVLKDYITSEIVKRVVEVLVGVSGFLGTFLAGSRKVLSFILKVKASKQQLIDKTQQAIKQKIDHARETVQKAAENVKTLTKQLENMRADRQLVDFIRHRYESSDYRDHLGVIARVRADFGHLSALLRDVQNESEKEINDMMERKIKTEGERKENDTNAAPLFPRIDRIILYVDDLDRCPEKNVFEVLQAVHLLLAFPLFVVVVGVDPRWLLHSLRQHSAPFQKDEKSDLESESPEEDSHWQSTPLNYLEKIFQIPFTLRPIGKSGFGKLVDAFASQSKKPADRPGSLVPQPQPSEQWGSELSPPPAPVSQQEPPPVNIAPPSPPAKDAATPPVPATRAAPAAAPPRQPVSLEQTVTPLLREPIDRHPEHLRIEEQERVFMKTLYELIPSPRAGKRFINIYRLLRASVEDQERHRFIGSETGGEYQCALILLAILTGYPSEATEILEGLIKEEHNENWGEFLESVKNKMHSANLRLNDSHTSKGPKLSAQQKDRSGSPASYPAPDLQRWEELFAKLGRVKGNLDGRKCDGFVKWAPRVARYSFQSGRVLLHQRE
jgi:hypothetical protein